MSLQGIKVLYISYDGMTDPLGRSQVIPYLKGLARQGCDIHLLSVEKRKAYAKHHQDVQLLLQADGIKWHPIFYRKSPPVIGTLLDIRELAELALTLFKKEEFSIIHCRSYVSALIGLSLKRETDAKFLFDMRGFWIDERIEGGIWNARNPLFRAIIAYFRKKETEFFSEADFIISLTQRAKNHIVEKLSHRPASTIAVIPCCVDLEHFDFNNQSVSHNDALAESLGVSKTDFVISYLGALGTWYMLTDMLLFFKVLLSHKPDAKFLFITPETSEFVLSEAHRMGIPTDRILVRSADRDEVPALVSLSKLSLCFVRPTYSKIASSPTKVAELLALGIPVICNKGVGDLDLHGDWRQSGIKSTDLGEAGFEATLQEIDALMLVEKERIRRYAQANFSLEQGVLHYAEVYRKLL